MKERLLKRIEIEEKEYKEMYEYELDNKEDYELTEEQWDFVSEKRNDIMSLYWILDGEVKIRFLRDKIIKEGK